MIYLDLSLNWRDWCLLIAAIVNLLMPFFVLNRGIKKNKIHFYFSLLTFFCFTWAIGLFFARLTTDLFFISIFARSTYISALCIILSLFYFSLHFPYFYKEINKKLTFFIWLFFGIISVLIYTDWFIVSFVLSDGPGGYVSFFYLQGYILYFVYFIFLAVLSLFNLFQKYRNLEGILKKHLLLLFLTILIGLIFGIYFDLFLLIFQEFSFNWFGPVFTIFMNSLVFYFIFFTKEK